MGPVMSKNRQPGPSFTQQLEEASSEPAQGWVPCTGTDQRSEAGSVPEERPPQPEGLVDVEASVRGTYVVEVGEDQLGQVLKGP